VDVRLDVHPRPELLDGPDRDRLVRADRSIGDKWLISSGLAAGDRVIVEGLAKIKPGQKVRPVPAGSPPLQPKAGAGASASRQGG